MSGSDATPHREDPGLDTAAIAAGLDAQYGIAASRITYLPIGYDLNAAVYEVIDTNGTAWFLKVRSGPIDEIALQVPRALLDHGIAHVLAPLRARSGNLWAPCGERRLVLYPFVHGQDAMTAGMNDTQWRQFGATLRAVHDSGLAQRFHNQLPAETFALPSAALVRQVTVEIEDVDSFASHAATRFAAFWREQADVISAILARAEALGRQLQGKAFDHVLCHADIHAANILVGEDGQIFLIDWDGPKLAPRERDLVFVIGSRIAREVTPREEALFFEGYGPVNFDPGAIIYSRYERIIEDLGEFGKSVLLDQGVSEATREDETALAMSFFAPGGIIARAETVTLFHASVVGAAKRPLEG